MGFTFGFTEDIEENDLGKGKDGNNKFEKFSNPIDNVKILQDPQLHSLEKLIEMSFKDSRITFEPVKISDNMTIYRRELFDVRHQLMMEDDTMNNNTNKEEFNILIGETGEDLRNGVYEGGLKSWECSFDMISKLKDTKIIENLLSSKSKFNVIELGCGTSLPTLYILRKIFAQSSNEPISIILSDYNFDVLRLVTLPNILLNWCFTFLTEDELSLLQQRNGIDGNIRDGEIDITNNLLNKFTNWMKERKIEINFISGSWCRKFMNIINEVIPNMENEFNIVMTSETIYSLDILPVISEIMVEFATKNRKGVTLLSAKDIYFGVGGSIVECRAYLESRGASVDTTSISDSFKRSVLSIRM